MRRGAAGGQEEHWDALLPRPQHCADVWIEAGELQGRSQTSAYVSMLGFQS